jgi:hypothetical protein
MPGRAFRPQLCGRDVPKTKQLQTNFSAGEISPDLAMRQDTEQYQNGAKSLHNRRCLFGGGTVRRPGTWKQPDLAGPSRTVEWIVNRTTQYVAVFGAERAAFYLRNTTTGFVTASGSLSSCPWTAGIWEEMDMVQFANTMFLTHPDMPTQVITRTGAATWVRAAFAFHSGPAGRPEQPYLKFAPASMTLTASDVTGSITLTVSGAVAWFVSAHIGTYIRYHGKACLITAVAVGGLSCTATVVETLPETYSVQVASSTNYAVGEAVEGSVTGAKGIITSIPDATHVVVVLTNSLITFTTADAIVSPNASQTVVAVATTTNAAVADWDEQMFSAVYGYPAHVRLHRGRLLMGGHAEAPDYLAGSALGNLYDFNVGDASDADGFLESLGDAGASRITGLHSAEQLLIATDRGLYYVPESEQSPFRPTSLAFVPFGSPWPISPNVRPRAFDGGVLFVAGSLVIKASPTGNQRSTWSAAEVSPISDHLFSTPSDLAVVANFSAQPENYAVLRNSDGTLGVLQLVEAQKTRNATPWETDRAADTFVSTCAIEGDLYVHCVRAIAGSTIYTLELFDQDITLDYASELTDLDDVEATYGATEVNVVTESGLHLGTYPLSLPGETPDGPYIVGLLYGSEIETFPPVIQDSAGNRAGDMQRILEAYVHVTSSARFAAEGHELTAYQASDDLTEPPPLKNGPQRFQFLGWRREPTILITQTDPLPLKVLAIKQLVAY